jgi:N-hydroxyarylamine O-acetyltransferase
MQELELEAYLSRIGYEGPRMPGTASLTAVHRAHALAVPFENIDIHLGRPIRLDLPSLLAKIVTGRRGGYCFEQNTLFLAALRALGFDVIACEARVLAGAPGGSVRPRTHMALVASMGGRAWLCDVGFGGDGPVEPVPLDGSEVTQLGDELRVAEEGRLQILQVRRDGGWEDQYAFLPEERFPVDFEVGNWYTSTHPESRFVTTLTAQRVCPDVRHVLRGLTCVERRGEETTTRELAREELLPFLRDVIGIDLPEGTRFRSLDQ